MPFSLDGTHISGGTFNNVSGNMSQVTNSCVVHGVQSVDQRSIDGPSDASTGSVALQRRAGKSANAHRPYDILNRVAQPGIQNFDSHGRRSGIDSRSANMHLGNNQIMPYGTGTPRNGSSPAAAAQSAPNPTFNSIGGDMTQVNLTSYGESGIDTLYRFVSIEALHNSGERFQEPACYPGTRTAILAELNAWAGSGPSTQVWTVSYYGSMAPPMFSGDCVTQHRLGASFFFRRGHSKRGTWHNLFTTIAYQLATSIPELLLPIQQAVESDKPIVGRAMAVQFQKLLIQPCRNFPASQFAPIIILDGLDECDDHKAQQQILRLFIHAIQTGQLPARILICSRPEPHLREVLETPETSGICRHSTLTADEAAYDDIRLYLRNEFSRIHSEYASRGIDLGAPWPAPGALDHLVWQSSGVFIYAATVIRFVDDEYSHPTDRLDSVLRLDPQSTTPLDDLYTQILMALPHNEQQLRILHAIWRRPPEGLWMDPEEIDMLLGLRPGACRLALRGLHSLLLVPEICTLWSCRGSVEFLHASFRDYLSHPYRSQWWCISTSWLKSDYLCCMVQLLSSPAPTFSVRDLYRFPRRVVKALPGVLPREAPSQELIALLRNRDFQDSLFLEAYSYYHMYTKWPQSTTARGTHHIRRI
ncbi:hypothetical protein B0H11DRAFT_1918976 [Mycena galericulata]|nr:hypothetical protein B0H11DRAFT_1918976 [Mycena galericulata]